MLGRRPRADGPADVSAADPTPFLPAVTTLGQLQRLAGELAEPPATAATVAGRWSLDGTTVLLGSDGLVHLLDRDAAELWSLLVAGLSATEALTELAARHDSHPETLADAVCPLVARLPRPPSVPDAAAADALGRRRTGLPSGLASGLTAAGTPLA
jgi:hypothetical protein